MPHKTPPVSGRCHEQSSVRPEFSVVEAEKVVQRPYTIPEKIQEDGRDQSLPSATLRNNLDWNLIYRNQHMKRVQIFMMLHSIMHQPDGGANTAFLIFVNLWSAKPAGQPQNPPNNQNQPQVSSGSIIVPGTVEGTQIPCSFTALLLLQVRSTTQPRMTYRSWSLK